MVLYHASETLKKHDTEHRAGCIILNRKDKTILIIQSYGTFWGLPKGHMEKNESIVQCAIRETYEETGIELTEKDLSRPIELYNGEVTYFFVEGDNLKYDLDKIQDKGEITNIKWISIDFLEKNKNCQKNKCNSHLKKLIPLIQKEFISRH